MLAINRTQYTFTIAHQNLSEYKAEDNEKSKTRIVIRVDKTITKYIKNTKKYYGFVSETTKGDFVEMTFMSNHIDNGFVRWFLMFADHATILEPESLKGKITTILTNALNNIQKTT